MKERELEDIICENIDTIFDWPTQLIGRQIPLVHGRLDILAYQLGHPLVIELKARTLRSQDIGQILRYVQDLRKALFCTFNGLMAHLHNTEQNKSLWGNMLWENLMDSWDEWEHHQLIEPILIGPKAPVHIVEAASAANIKTMEYRANPKTRTLSLQYARGDSAIEHYDNNRPGWAAELVELIKADAQKEANHCFERTLHHLFAPGRQEGGGNHGTR